MTSTGLPTERLEPTRQVEREKSGALELRLVIAGPGRVDTFPLVIGQEYLVGRGPEAHIRLDDAATSRPHARIAAKEWGIEVTDLNSANGTVVADRIYKETGEVGTLRPGQVMTMGSTTLLLQRSPTMAPTHRKTWSHLYFRGRVEEECDRASIVGAPFSVVRLRIVESIPDATILTSLSTALRPQDLLARFGPSDWELLLLADKAQSQLLVQRVGEALGPRGKDLRTGIATYNVDGRDPESLIAAAAVAMQEGPAPPPSAQGLHPAAEGPMRGILEAAGKAAASEAGILVLGETGVGKSLLARWIHERSPRRAGPLVEVDLGNTAPTLVEDELFGHVKGAFTGATSNKTGQIEQASGGTLFLDEIGDMPFDQQGKLLRVLQEKEVRPLGAAAYRRVDIRVIAGTHQDLRKLIEEGRFREDLYRRLDVITLEVPPLRRRRGEIEPLARKFLARLAEAEKKAIPDLSPDALAALEAYDWPGNVRELENVMYRAVVMCSHRTIEVDDLELSASLRASPSDEGQVEAEEDLFDLSEAQLKERATITKLLEKHRWNKERAWKDFGKGRTTFFQRCRLLRIPGK